MAWQNYKWAWNLRGITMPERTVVLYLAEQASASGNIDLLRHGRLANACGCSAVNARRYVYRFLQIGLIKERTYRFKASGEQSSNAYQLNLKWNHPADSAGPALLKLALEAWREKDKGNANAIEFHSDGADSYFDKEAGRLHIWLDGRRAVTFFELHRSQLAHYSSDFHHKIKSFEFIA